MTYSYTCTYCFHNWEAEQRITEPPLKCCPQCENDTAKRLIDGGTGFRLKGQCWSTDGFTRLP